MRSLILTALAASGCLRNTAFQCANDTACGAGGVCEVSGFCSVGDADCPSGRRYGDSAGSKAGQCTDGTQMGSDGSMPDTPMTPDARIDGTVTVGCPSGYNLVSGAGTHLYKVVLSTDDWSTQQAGCRATTQAANLFMPDDLAELTAIDAIATVPGNYWLGIQDPAEGTYINALDMAQTFLPWTTGAPDDGPPSEDCVEGLKATDKINDRRCSDKLAAVCECAPP